MTCSPRCLLVAQALTFIGVVQRAFSGVRLDLLHDSRSIVSRNRRRLDHTVVLTDAKHDYFAGSASANVCRAERLPKVISSHSSAPVNGSRRFSSEAHAARHTR